MSEAPNADNLVTSGPCEPWVTGADVADCCGVEFSSDNAAMFEQAAENASGILFSLSGGLYRGVCGPVTVRPCRTGSVCYVPGRSDRIDSCGCAPLSQVLLPGYPVIEITEVKIDGVVLDPSEYRLDGHRKLTRMATAEGSAQVWPSCQRLDLDDTEERTFSVSYWYGMAPPELGVEAAAQLGCEIYRSCSSDAGECAIPSGVTRVTREGITTEYAKIAQFLRGGQTGLVKVDAFLASAGSGGATRRPAIWSPDGPRYAKQLG